MSGTGFRAVRELRGDDPRPFTPRGERPGTASGGRQGTPPTNQHQQAEIDALRKELEESQLALEKEKRNSRSLEQYHSEALSSKEHELAQALSEAKVAQANLLKAEQHAAQLEDLYKGQVAKLSATVERLQARAPGDAAVGGEGDSFAAVLREEMRVMQTSFQLKLQRAQDEAASKQLEASKQLRALQEELVEEKRKNSNLLDKISRSPTSPTAASSSSSSAFPAAPATARTGSAGNGGVQPAGSLSSRAGIGAGAAGAVPGSLSTGTKPVVKATKAK